MPLNYMSGYNEDINALGRAPGIVGSLAASYPLMKIQAEQMRQQQALLKATEILRREQARQESAQASYYNAQTVGEEAKTAEANALAQAADKAGQLSSLAQIIRMPSAMMNENPIARQALISGMESGYLPQGFQGDQKSIADALEAQAFGLGARNALSQPTAAASFMRPNNLGQGEVGIGPFGQTQVGLPKPIVAGMGDLIYQSPADTNPLSGMVSMSPGERTFMPGQTEPAYEGGPQDLRSLLSSALGGLVYKGTFSDENPNVPLRGKFEGAIEKYLNQELGIKDNEVVRKVNGKLAVFDKNTKQFIRYAE